jgi:DNA polymerase epsilon subunit 2
MAGTMNRRRQFVRTCKKQGLHVQPAALQSMMTEINDEESLLRALKWLTQMLARRTPKIVTLDLWEQAVEACFAAPDVNNKRPNNILPKTGDKQLIEFASAFDSPKLIYNSLRQQFYFSEKQRPPLFGSAQDKIEMMTQRYAFVHQRVVRQMENPLTCVDRLLGMSHAASRSESQVLLGMLHRHPDGLELEDLTGTILLKGLENATIQKSGFYTEGSIVMVNGQYDNGVFFVERMGFPMLESKAETLPFLPPQKKSLRTKSQHPLIIYSMANVGLDRPDKRQALQDLIGQLIEEPNEALLVLFGNFTTESLTLPVALDELASILEDVPQRHTIAVMPGPNDTPSACWPLPPMKSYSLSQLPQVQLVSNPCRLEYGNQQIVLVRKDLIRDHLQSQVLTVSGAKQSLATRVVNTILSQGHIMPQAPIYWNYDHAMHLYPLPDLLLLGLEEGEERLECSKEKCHVVIPGPSWAKVTMSSKGKAQVQYSQDDIEESDDEIQSP